MTRKWITLFSFLAIAIGSSLLITARTTKPAPDTSLPRLEFTRRVRNWHDTTIDVDEPMVYGLRDASTTDEANLALYELQVDLNNWYRTPYHGTHMVFVRRCQSLAPSARGLRFDCTIMGTDYPATLQSYTINATTGKLEHYSL
jgi:hypothetical protein